MFPAPFWVVRLNRGAGRVYGIYSFLNEKLFDAFIPWIFRLVTSRSVSTGYVNVSGTTLIGMRSVCTFVLVSQWALIIRYYKIIIVINNKLYLYSTVS